jgi:hypothetical protein
MKEHPDITAYKEKRARVYADFLNQLAKDIEALKANPEDFDLQAAIGIVGVDDALALYLAGKLADKPR